MNRKLFIFLLVAFITIRLVFTLLPSFKIDMTDWQSWASRLVEVGPMNFYNPNYFADYFPGYLYILWVISLFFHTLLPSVSFFSIEFSIYLKIITNFFDIATAYLIFRIVSNYSKGWAQPAVLLYIANPALIFNTSVWGQIDGILTFFLVLSLYSFLELRKTIQGSATTVLSLLIKPQALAALPVIFTHLITNFKLKTAIISTIILIFLSIIISIPFFIKNPIFGLLELFQKTAGGYKYTSLYAFNIWAIIGWWQDDTKLFFNIPFQIWGLIMYLTSLVFIIAPLFKKDRADIKPLTYFAVGLSYLAFFLFPTRVHERYLFPFFAFAAITLSIYKNLPILITYLILSVLHFLNLWYVYFYFNFVYNNPDYQGNLIFQIVDKNYNLIAIIILLSFFVLLYFYYKLNRLKINMKGLLKPKILLIAILIFAAVTRLFNLNYPKAYVFDEVYHAFTAKEYTKGSKNAWDPWATPPKGLAYEWTHPPLAKEIMAFSMISTGSDEAWAWRLPGALLGVLSVYLVYLLGLRLLNSQTASLIAAFVFSIDGLNFVQSRVGMNDIYFVTFILTSLLFLLNRRFLLSAILFGLALSSKWASMYFILLIIPTLFLQKNKSKIIYFILVPPIIYLLSYLPYFLLGYSPTQFVDLQKQIWWYHTNLKATHDYASPWWSWPLNLYPVWYFVDYQKDQVANIFASGNPAVFWVGSVSMLLTAWQAVKQKSVNLIIVVLGFLVFWLPWSISPRIMFLYHFSPSVPFLTLSLGYQLSQGLEDEKMRRLFFMLLFLMILSFILIFPFLTGLPIPKDFVNLFFATNLGKNPFLAN